ncbi:MAG: Uncharacterised protein [Prochlorococcus marinus str. MIT 9215]|nr:MAG: Uncharacterised protein [Prochlorococcus marinus str. MIT 9215]
MAKNQARQHRREGQGIEGGDGYGEGNRESKLLVNDADTTWIEGHRHEYSHQHQGCGDQGSKKLTHAFECCSAGLHALLDIAGHRFNDHDRVINHQACG